MSDDCAKWDREAIAAPREDAERGRAEDEWIERGFRNANASLDGRRGMKV